MARSQSKPRWGTLLSRNTAAATTRDTRSNHCHSRSDKGEIAARAGCIKAAGSGLSGRNFILDIEKAFSLENLRRSHEALSKIQVPGPHFKLSIPAHGAASSPKALQIEGAFEGKHSLSQPKADNAGWYMYNRKKQFPFRWLTLRLLKLVCPVQQNTGIVSYTDDTFKRLIFLLKSLAAPVRRVHYNIRPSGRASDLPHGLAPCARKGLSGVGKPLALWDDSGRSRMSAVGGLGDSEASAKAPWGKSPRVLGIGRTMQQRGPLPAFAQFSCAGHTRCC